MPKDKSQKREDRMEKMRGTLRAEVEHTSGRAALTNHRFAMLAAADEAGAAHPTFSAESDSPKRLKVKIALVDDNPYNPRQIYLPEIVKERATSIAAHGQQEPAKAALNPDAPGRYILIDGGYRKRALLLLGKDEIEIELRDVRTPIEFYTLGRMFNKERDGGSALDEALSWRVLLDAGLVASEEALTEVVDLSWPSINKCLALTKLPAAAIEKMREHPQKIGVAVGYELYQFAGFSTEEQVLALIDRIVREDLSSREVEQIRKSAQNPAKRRAKQVSRQYKLLQGENTVGYVKDWDNGKVTFEIRGLGPDARAALVADLQQRFSAPRATEPASD